MLLVITDDQPWDSLPSGTDPPAMPWLESRLADPDDHWVRFTNALAQVPLCCPSRASILTGLYPSTHGIASYNDRLPASATTIAEVYREAGYATLSLSSVVFTGQLTNLHQGFEELHESTSLQDAGGVYTSKTGREYVDRAAEWIEQHKDEPFFIYLHVFDPHSPYEPRRPYDALWADQARREEHIKQREALRTVAGYFWAFLPTT